MNAEGRPIIGCQEENWRVRPVFGLCEVVAFDLSLEELLGFKQGSGVKFLTLVEKKKKKPFKFHKVLPALGSSKATEKPRALLTGMFINVFLLRLPIIQWGAYLAVPTYME